MTVTNISLMNGACTTRSTYGHLCAYLTPPRTYFSEGYSPCEVVYEKQFTKGAQTLHNVVLRFQDFGMANKVKQK